MEKSQIATSLFSLLRSFKQNMQRELKAMDLGITFLHFITLKETQINQPCTAQQLTEVMGLDKAQISRLLKELINKDLICKEENPDDKRSQLLSLTKKGEQFAAKFIQAQERLALSMVEGLSAKDTKQWVNLTKLIAENLETIDQA